MTLFNSGYDQYMDVDGNSVLNVVSNGSPTNDEHYRMVSLNVASNMVKSNNNAGDTVGYVLGGNGNVLDFGGGVVGTVLLTNLFKKYNLPSRHSNYNCVVAQCNYNKYLQP